MDADAAINSRFPIKLVTVAFALTVVTFIWFGYVVLDARRDEKFQEHASHIEELRGIIVHLDEAMTMSARLAATTGESQWEERYRRFEPQLDAALKEIIELGTSLPSRKAAIKTDEANKKLVEMENRAFALLRAGRREDARAILCSADFEMHKAIYAEGMTTFIGQIKGEIDERLSRDQQFDLLSLIAAVVVGGISFVSWLSMMRGLRRWRAQLLESFHRRTEAEENLRQTHAELEARIQERTAELAKANAALHGEIVDRKQAEVLLQKSKEHLQHLISANPAVIYSLKFHHGELVPTWISDNVVQLTGHTPEESLMPNWWADGLHPDDRERVHAEHDAQFPDDRLLTEYRFRHKDGSHVWVRDEKSLLRDAAGNPVEVVGSWADITASKSAIQELDHIFTLSQDLLCLAGFDGFFKRLNPAWQRLLGWTNEELLSRPFIELVHPDDAEKTQAEMRTLADGAETALFEIRILCQDGSYRWVQWNGNPIRGEPRFYAAGRDITERKHTEEKLWASEQRFRQLAENIHDVFWMTSADLQKMIYVSPPYERIWGRSVESLYSNPQEWTEATVSEDQPRVFEAARKFAELQSEFDEEYRIIRPDGSVRWIHARGSQVRDAQGNVQHTVGMASDITERKMAEASLQEMHRKLVDASREAGMAVIATSVLHNVGNVLNSVNVAADRVSDKVKRLRPASLAKLAALLRVHAHDLPDFLARDPQGKELPGYLCALVDQLADPHKNILPELESLKKNVEHIREIVSMQQNYARLPGVLETIALADLVEDAIRINAAGFARHEVELIRQYSPVPPFRMEKHKVLQILVNLLSNAKYALDASQRPDRKLTVSICPHGNNSVKISVIDNGVGIAAENLTRIFQHGFTTRKDGHGFGLHSGVLAAEEIGATLTAYSEGPGKGAVFTLELSCQISEQAA